MPKYLSPSTTTDTDQYKSDPYATKYFYEGTKFFKPPPYRRVLFGRLADLSKEESTQDLLKKGNKSRYSGWVFQTEHHHEEWSITKDEAFYAGAMQAKKVFQLITNLDDCINAEVKKFDHYMKENAAYFYLNPDACMKRDHRVGVTLREILWMVDNNYTYRISTRNALETVFEPPTKRKGQVTIINYNPNLWTPSDWKQSVIDRLIKIKTDIHMERTLKSKKINEQMCGQRTP